MLHGLCGTLYAHDRLYVIENFDETKFGVIEKINPARSNIKANLVLEVFKNGDIRDAQDYRGNLARMRNIQKLYAQHHSSFKNSGTGSSSAGLVAGTGRTSNRKGMSLGSNDGDAGVTDGITGYSTRRGESETAAKINTSLTMQRAKDMIQRAFVFADIKNFYNGEYKNVDEWLKGQGAEKVGDDIFIASVFANYL